MRSGRQRHRGSRALREAFVNEVSPARRKLQGEREDLTENFNGHVGGIDAVFKNRELDEWQPKEQTDAEKQ